MVKFGHMVRSNIRSSGFGLLTLSPRVGSILYDSKILHNLANLFGVIVLLGAMVYALWGIFPHFCKMRIRPTEIEHNNFKFFCLRFFVISSRICDRYVTWLF